MEGQVFNKYVQLCSCPETVYCLSGGLLVSQMPCSAHIMAYQLFPVASKRYVNKVVSPSSSEQQRWVARYMYLSQCGLSVCGMCAHIRSVQHVGTCIFIDIVHLV